MAHFLRTLFLFRVIVPYAASVGTEIRIRAVEEDVFPQAAFQRSIVERNLHGWLKPYLCKLLITIANDPCVPTLEALFQGGPDASVEHVEVFGTQSLSIRRIRHQYALRSIVGPFSDGFALQLHHIVDAGILNVFSGDCHGLGVDVAAIYLIGEFLFGGIIVVDIFEKLLVEIRPFLKSEALPIDAGIDVRGNQGSLNQERAGAAHRVDEIGIPAPPGLKDNSCGKRLVDGGFGSVGAVSAFGERFAAGVERDSDSVVGDMDVELEVGSGEANRGSASILVVEMVGYAVLHSIGHELGVGEIRAVDGGVDREGGINRHELFPVKIAHVVVKLVGGVSCEFYNRLKNPQSRSAAEVCAIHNFVVAFECDHTRAGLHVFGAQLDELVAEHVFKALEGFGNHLEFSFHLFD